jgi:ribose 5-phosphate isomerase A
LTIYERALEMVPDGSVIGLGSGRAAWAFVQLLGERISAGRLNVRGVPASDATAHVAEQHGVPLVDLADAGELSLTVDGADEVDPNLDLIKGYGRALLREKVVAASSRQLIILVGQEKIVPRLATRGLIPIEVVPFAVPLCERRLRELRLSPVLWADNGKARLTDNGNNILDCETDPLSDPIQLEADIRAIPGVAGTGLFLGMADTVLIGNDRNFQLTAERRRTG